MQAIQDESNADMQSEGCDITLTFRGLVEEKLAEGARKVVGVAEAEAELDFRQLECITTRKVKLSPDVGLLDQAFGVQLNVQELSP